MKEVDTYPQLKEGENTNMDSNYNPENILSDFISDLKQQCGEIIQNIDVQKEGCNYTLKISLIDDPTFSKMKLCAERMGDLVMKYEKEHQDQISHITYIYWNTVYEAVDNDMPIKIDFETFEGYINTPINKIDEINKFITSLYQLRKESIKEDGEQGIGNRIYKEFRSLGYINNLKTLKRTLKDQELSLENLEESQNNSSMNSDNLLYPNELLYLNWPCSITYPEISDEVSIKEIRRISKEKAEELCKGTWEELGVKAYHVIEINEDGKIDISEFGGGSYDWAIRQASHFIDWTNDPTTYPKDKKFPAFKRSSEVIVEATTYYEDKEETIQRRRENGNYDDEDVWEAFTCEPVLWWKAKEGYIVKPR